MAADSPDDGAEREDGGREAADGAQRPDGDLAGTETDRPSLDKPPAGNPEPADEAEQESVDPEPADAEPVVPEPADRAYSPALIATAVALPVILVVGVLVAAVMARNLPTEREPLALGPVPAPAADGPACQALLPALPADLGDYTKATLIEPAPPATRAWQPEGEGEPVVLRCGLDRPLEFNRASSLQIVNGVQWFQIRDDAAATSTWFAVDRETYIALTVPDSSGPTPLQTVSDTITATLPAREIDPGPLPN